MKSCIIDLAYSRRHWFMCRNELWSWRAHETLCWQCFLSW